MPVNVTTAGGGFPRKLPGASTPTSEQIVSASTPDPRALSDDERALIREALDLSILIYAPLAEVVAALKEDGCEHVTPLDHWEMQGVCFTRGERAFLVFRGIVSATDWLVDFFFLPLLWPLQHLGFGLGWRALRGDARADRRGRAPMSWLAVLPARHGVVREHPAGERRASPAPVIQCNRRGVLEPQILRKGLAAK